MVWPVAGGSLTPTYIQTKTGERYTFKSNFNSYFAEIRPPDLTGVQTQRSAGYYRVADVFWRPAVQL